MDMDPQYSFQDVIRCGICDTPLPFEYCEICHIHLCTACVGVHISHKYNEHYIVPSNLRRTTPTCQKHSKNVCKEFCESCCIPVCTICVASSEHDKHTRKDILNVFYIKKELIKKDLQDFEKNIYPRYEGATTNISAQENDVGKNCTKLTNALDKQRDALHREIDIIFQAKKSEIDSLHKKHLAVIHKQKAAINHAMTEMARIISDLKSLLNTNDICQVSEYTSRNEEYVSLPFYFTVTLPIFRRHEINKKQIEQLFGPILYPARMSIEEPLVQTFYGVLSSASCRNDSEIWTCCMFNKIMSLYNLKGELLLSVPTKSGKPPWDIAVTRNGDLVYTDHIKIYIVRLWKCRT